MRDSKDLLPKVASAIKRARMNAHPLSDYGWVEADAAIKAVAAWLAPDIKENSYTHHDLCASEHIAWTLLNAIKQQDGGK